MPGRSLIQWNCRGFRANFNELKILCERYNPLAFCLQETYFKPTDCPTFKNFCIYNSYGPDGNRPSGGTSILIRQDIIHSNIPLNTNLQVIALRVTLHKTITLCSIYLPPQSNFTSLELINLTNQLPSPYVIMGDFNGHNPLWGSNTTDAKGKRIEDFLEDQALCLLNDGSKTYLHPGYGTYSAIDLTLTVPDLMLDFSWRVLHDLHGSDHFPILAKIEEPDIEAREPRWRLDKADWEAYQRLCRERLQAHTVDERGGLDSFSATLLSIAAETIPKTSTIPKRPRNPWFDGECKKAINARKKAERKFHRRPTAENLQIFKIRRARARRIINAAKRQSWKDFVSGISSRTPMKKVWSMVRKVKGKGGDPRVQHLHIGTDIVTTPAEIAEKLADTFQHHSSSANCLNAFKQRKTREEQKSLHFGSNNTEHYNLPFTLEELNTSIKRAHSTAVGPDKIHYDFLKHLPVKVLKVLLGLFNNIWKSGQLPASWKEATVIPIPKPGKDHKNPTNYRPIALTSCLCKTMERMVNARLVWLLESEHLISDFQSGFRRGRSTLDHLVSLESFVREAFIKKEHAVAVFFDLEKAYDTTWKHGIMKDLHAMGFRGRLPIFIKSFLANRHFRVRLNSTYSAFHRQEMGVPQGSILSVTLFNIKINSITKVIKDNITCSLYVDDFLICYRGKHMHSIERQLQLSLNKIFTWSIENGFKFSKTKTVAVHFCQLRTPHLDPELRLDSDIIQVVEETKFLGLTFDHKLSFLPHILSLKSKCLKALDIIKVLSNTKWGADTRVLLRLYRALIRSKLDYGSQVYGSARKSYIQKLDTVHHQGLRLAMGAFRTSPIQSLYVLSQEPSLEKRRLKLALQFALKLKTNTSNPAHEYAFNCVNEELYDARPKSIRPFGLRVKPYLEDPDIDLDLLSQNHFTPIPPWQIRKPNINLSLSELKKSDTPPLTYRSRFLDIRDRFPLHMPCYTDGSKEGETVAAAAVGCDRRVAVRLPDHISIFTAEACGLFIALKIIQTSEVKNAIIFSDSKSCLEALNSLKTDHPVLVKIMTKLRILEKTGCNIQFCWIPGHVGITGNETADQAAKMGLQKNIQPCPIPHTDLRALVKEYIDQTWQAEWDELPANKLHSIFPTVKDAPRGGSGEGLLPLRKNRPQVSPACRKRRSKRGDSFAVSRDPCRWRKRSWCHEDILVAGVSHLPNTALWLLLHLDGRLERARSNQSAGHAKP